LTLSPLQLDSQFVDMRTFVGLDPYGSNAELVDPRIAVVLRSPANLPGASIAPSRSAGEGSSKADAPALASEALDEGTKSVGKDVFEISNSSVSNPEGNQGEGSDKDDGGEAVNKEHSGETTGSEAHPPESQPEVREGEATIHGKGVNADRFVRACGSFGAVPCGGTVAQEQAEDYTLYLFSLFQL